MRAIVAGAIILASGSSTQLLACPWHGGNMRYSALFREMGPERHWEGWSEAVPEAVSEGTDKGVGERDQVPAPTPSSPAKNDEASPIRK